eukprot:SAG31_NODE_8867_length_1370_cov_3.715185_1_plen_137_part_10
MARFQIFNIFYDIYGLRRTTADRNSCVPEPWTSISKSTRIKRHGILFEHVAIKAPDTKNSGANEIFDEHSRYKGPDPIGIAKLQDESGFVALYIDDLIVFSDSIEEHKRHLLQVMQVCSDEGLFLNTGKSHIFTKYT